MRGMVCFVACSAGLAVAACHVAESAGVTGAAPCGLQARLCDNRRDLFQVTLLYYRTGVVLECMSSCPAIERIARTLYFCNCVS